MNDDPLARPPLLTNDEETRRARDFWAKTNPKLKLDGLVDGMVGASDDPVNHPAHYTRHPSGTECIEITEHMGFNLGNAIKYIWRSGEKGEAVQDLKKALWHLRREIKRIGGEDA